MRIIRVGIGVNAMIALFPPGIPEARTFPVFLGKIPGRLSWEFHLEMPGFLRGSGDGFTLGRPNSR